MSLRTYLSDEPMKVLDKLLNSFVAAHKHLLGNAEGIDWSGSVEATSQLMAWARSANLLTVEEKHDLDILIVNASKLLKKHGEKK